MSFMSESRYKNRRSDTGAGIKMGQRLGAAESAKHDPRV